ncbi:hypothetical protein QM012_002503 [Aureobasidium pullulans]|uniref:C2H2-type domain-containing protein n=1 Tax=Aureobasidium pullulans TaxID=5580 RepID=A0ABR0TC44_AURPU
MDTTTQSKFIGFGVEDTCYPALVVDDCTEAPSIQDSAYSSPRASSSWLSSEGTSDGFSGTWSSPAPSLVYSPSPQPAEYHNHYLNWSQANSRQSHQQHFTSLHQAQCQPEVSEYYQQEPICQSYYPVKYFQPQALGEQGPDIFGVGEWTAPEYLHDLSEQNIESLPTPSSTVAPIIVSSDGSPGHRKDTLIKQEEPPKYRHICANVSLRKQQANRLKTAYPCPFLPYGCPASFSSKNEWKRHLNTQHLSLSTYRCNLCVPKPCSSSSVQQSNDFNRKDLFIQHLRRMHCENSSELILTTFNNKTARYSCVTIPNTPASLAEQADRCHVQPPSPPASTQCLFCCTTFSGPQAWLQRTEHISRHFERLRRDGQEVPKVQEWRRDIELERWCLEIGVLVLHRGKDGIGRVRVKSGRKA